MSAYSIFDPFKISHESFNFWMEWIQEGAVFSAPTRVLFVEANNEMTSPMTSHIHLYKEKEVEKGVGEFREEKRPHSKIPKAISPPIISLSGSKFFFLINFSCIFSCLSSLINQV